MTSAEYQIEINNLVAKKDAALDKARSLRNSGQSWLDDANRTKTCRGTSQQRADCNAENNRKINLGNDYLSQAATLDKEAAQYQIQIDKLIDGKALSEKTYADVSKTLAEQNQTFEGVLVREQGNAAAVLQAQQAQSEIQMRSAQADIDNKQKYVLVGTIIFVIVLVVIGVKMWKKYKSKSK